jgi:hypothetical protein
MKLSEFVGKYIELRNQKAALKADYEAKVAGVDEKLDKIEAKLLEVFDQQGMDSVKTELGTAYKSTRTTASVADRDVFMNFVKAKEEWALLEVRAAKSAVEQYMTANEGVLPPGVNWRAEAVVNVRKSS